jgi:hypothetical protein
MFQGQWIFIGLELVLWLRSIQWVVVWLSTFVHCLVQRSAPDDGSEALKITQRQPQPSTFQWG